MFAEILSIFDYEGAEMNTKDVVCAVYENAKETLKTATGVLNTAQYVLVHMVKEIIEILPIEELPIILPIEKPIVLMLDHDAICQILVVNADHLQGRGLYNNVSTDPLTQNLIQLDGTAWKELHD
ncbi:hypothetical protein GQX74_005654 [Glossina fuscipes]|nr:hypothetical protein GQX74_005654 [Glossina fuscipes]